MTGTEFPPLIVIGGPTAAGKTQIAIELARRFPVRLISADSVQVYRGMDIGAAKPDPETLARWPHALIDIRDPEQVYTMAEFVADAGREIAAAHRAGRMPVLVGGTPMYLRALRFGIDPLPGADPKLRARLEREAQSQGWAALHARLQRLDPDMARRIRPEDPQRILRALELCELTGQPASRLHTGPGPDRMRRGLHLVICPPDRAELHRRIGQRWSVMLESGFLDEVRRLLARPGVHPELPALRAVGYRQAVQVLLGHHPAGWLETAGAAATRQLAKRQLTAFRQWPAGLWYDPLNRDAIVRIINRVERIIEARTSMSAC
ncbi:MAG: tRNA (adenosine(37)-N6)-dimethylallyltransferase MiaA [Wenzhouxiangellaceae bacterium]